MKTVRKQLENCFMPTTLAFLQQLNDKKPEKLAKFAKINERNLHIFCTIWWVSMEFSGEMSLMIILKVTKNQVFSLSLSISLFLFLFFSLTNTISEKQQGGEGRVKVIPLGFFSVNKFVNLLWTSDSFAEVYQCTHERPMNSLAYSNLFFS